VEIVLEDLKGLGGQGHDALSTTLAKDAKVGFGEREIFQLELEHFAGA
jgi:hypothetical protein